MKRALGIVALLVACRGGDLAGRAQDERTPRRSATPDVRLTALFDAIVRDALSTADKAELLHREANHVRDHVPEVYSIDDRRADLTVIGGGRRGDLQLDLSSAGARVIELRYQRGMRDYPSDLVDPQAEAARRAIDDCLTEDHDRALAIDRLGMLTMTLRIDHATDPASVRLVGGHGLESCVARRLVVLPADGVFLGVLRVYRQ